MNNGKNLTVGLYCDVILTIKCHHGLILKTLCACILVSVNVGKVIKIVLILAKSKQHHKVLAYPFLVDTKMHAHSVY